MRLLLDSHAIIWAVDRPARLGPQAAAGLVDASNELLVSSATIWEVAIKVGLGKLALTMPYRQWMTLAIHDLGLEVLSITVDYADVQAKLPVYHRDPFDRLLVAQATVDHLTVVSNDSVFDRHGIPRLW